MTIAENIKTAPRDELVEAMLPHVAFDGWGTVTRELAAEDIGMSVDVAAGLIADAAAAVDAANDLADRQMARGLDGLDPRPEKISAIIRAAVLLRLEQAEDHRPAVAQGLKVLARPQHAKLAAKVLYRTVDRIWRLTGDRATDISFYTKRATLAGVYSATLLYWTANPNAEREKIAAFLDQRLGEVAVIPKVTTPIKSAAEMGFKLVSKIIGRMPTRHSG